MNTREFSFIKLDLEKIKTKQDLIDFVNLHHIPEGNVPIDLLISNLGHFKFCILDKNTLHIIGFVVHKNPTKIYTTDGFENEVFTLPKSNFKMGRPIMNLDSILEKITKVGFNNLTSEEKEFLAKESQKK